MPIESGLRAYCSKVIRKVGIDHRICGLTAKFPWTRFQDGLDYMHGSVRNGIVPEELLNSRVAQ